jgi:hypothetical protein
MSGIKKQMTDRNGRGPSTQIANSVGQGSLIAVLALSAISGSFGIAKATPQELDCILTDVETKSEETKFDSQVAFEKRAIIVTFDEQQGSLNLRQGTANKPFQDVTITPTSMNGAADGISLGIDRSSWRIVFQTYGPNSVRNEFGICNLRPKSG